MTKTVPFIIGDVLVYQSWWRGSPPGPVIKITEFQESGRGPVIIGTVIDALDSPYTAGLPFAGMASRFSHYEPPAKTKED